MSQKRLPGFEICIPTNAMPMDVWHGLKERGDDGTVITARYWLAPDPPEQPGEPSARDLFYKAKFNFFSTRGPIGAKRLSVLMDVRSYIRLCLELQHPSQPELREAIDGYPILLDRRRERDSIAFLITDTPASELYQWLRETYPQGRRP